MISVADVPLQVIAEVAGATYPLFGEVNILFRIRVVQLCQRTDIYRHKWKAEPST